VNPESIDLTTPALKPDCPNYVRNAQAVKKASDALQECLNQQAYFLVYLVEECLGGAHNLRKPIADSCGDETADYVISRYLQLQSEHKAVSEQFLAAVHGQPTATASPRERLLQLGFEEKEPGRLYRRIDGGDFLLVETGRTDGLFNCGRYSSHEEDAKSSKYSGFNVDGADTSEPYGGSTWAQVDAFIRRCTARKHGPRFYRDELVYDLTEKVPALARVVDIGVHDQEGNEDWYTVCRLLEDGSDDDDKCYHVHASEISRTTAPMGLPEWSDADSDAAQKQGWDIFTLTPGEGRHRQWEIEGLTEWPEKLGYPTDYLPPFYEDDPAAAYHVQAKAKLHQDPLAIRAIEFLVARGQRDVETFKLWEALPDGNPYKPKFRQEKPCPSS
jgi:hypothetical protein